MQREHVHQLVVGASLLIEFRVVVHQRDWVVHWLGVTRIISHWSWQGQHRGVCWRLEFNVWDACLGWD
jgi:hypothetical protein